MGIVTLILVGIAAGLAFGFAAARYGLLEDSIVGIVGSIIGGWLYAELAGFDLTTINPLGALVALLGAVVLLAFSRQLTRSRNPI